MTPDPKPVPRVKDRGVYHAFHASNVVCLGCGGRNPQAHHMVRRSQGGDDILANFLPLCTRCHQDFHNANAAGEIVQENIARFVESDLGERHAAYLIEKLGAFGAEWFVKRLKGELKK